MAWLDDCNKEQDKKIQATGVSAGWWINLRDCYGDVWQQVEHVWTIGQTKNNALMAYKLYLNNQGESYTEYTFFYNIRKVSEFLPNDASSVSCVEGIFNSRKNNLGEIPKKYFKPD